MIVNHITQLDTDGRVSSSHVIAMTDNSDLARVRILRGGGGGGGGATLISKGITSLS